MWVITFTGANFCRTTISTPQHIAPTNRKAEELLIMHAWPRRDDVKTVIPLKTVRVIRKKEDDKRPGLEIISGETAEPFHIVIKNPVRFWAFSACLTLLCSVYANSC